MTGDGRNHYQILGVPQTAPEEEIRRAFRRLALEYHPDRNKSPDAAVRFKEANEAYQVLIDPQKRANYDHPSWINTGPNARRSAGFTGFDPLGGFGEIFDAFFEGFEVSPKKGRQRRKDLTANLNVAFKEAAIGCQKEVTIRRMERCASCAGSGCSKSSQRYSCPNCQGAGRIKRSYSVLFGPFVQTVLCRHCQGVGELNTHPCEDCKGTRRQRRTRHIPIHIPAGSHDRATLRLQGEGDAGDHGSPGNLFVLLHVEPHPIFRRDKADLLLNLPITMPQAALGCVVEVPTLGDVAQLKIPMGTQSGATFRLKGKGLPLVGTTQQGDLCITIQVKIPSKLSDHQRQLMMEFAQTLSKTHYTKAESQDWFSRLRHKLGDGE